MAEHHTELINEPGNRQFVNNKKYNLIKFVY